MKSAKERQGFILRGRYPHLCWACGWSRGRLSVSARSVRWGSRWLWMCLLREVPRSCPSQPCRLSRFWYVSSLYVFCVYPVIFSVCADEPDENSFYREFYYGYETVMIDPHTLQIYLSATPSEGVKSGFVATSANRGICFLRASVRVCAWQFVAILKNEKE